MTGNDTAKHREHSSQLTHSKGQETHFRILLIDYEPTLIYPLPSKNRSFRRINPLPNSPPDAFSNRISPSKHPFTPNLKPQISNHPAPSPKQAFLSEKTNTDK